MPFDVCVVLYRDSPDRVLRALRPDDRLFVHDNTEVNLGFAAGANRAAAQGSGRLLLFINSDGDLEPGALDVLERALCEPGVAAVEASQPGRFDRGLDPTWLSGACLAVHRETYRQVHGFDERLFLYGEDVDFSYRIASLGRLVHAPEARFRHDDHPAHRRGRWRAQHLMYRNWLLVHHWHRRPTGFWRTVWAGLGCLAFGHVVTATARFTGAASYLLRRLAWPEPMSLSAGARPQS